MINFIIFACRIYSRLKWHKNYKNRLSLTKVIVKNKMSHFLWFTVYMVRSDYHHWSSWLLLTIQKRTRLSSAIFILWNGYWLETCTQRPVTSRLSSSCAMTWSTPMQYCACEQWKVWQQASCFRLAICFKALRTSAVT